MTDEFSEFSELAQLLAHDQGKVQRVVWEFFRVATKDLHRLEQAIAEGEWQMARNLADRIHMSCLHVCERDAAEAAAMLAGISCECFAEVFRHRRPRIADALDHAERFLGRGIAGAEQDATSLLKDWPCEAVVSTARPHSRRPELSRFDFLLTPKESEILRMLAQRRSTKLIARTLGIGSETVNWHIKNIFKKLNAHRRRQAVDRALLLGLLALPPLEIDADRRTGVVPVGLA